MTVTGTEQARAEQARAEPHARPRAGARARGRATAGPSRGLRLGYASGSLVTGTFTTLPGLLLLPYLTDTLGVGAALAGAIVFLPKAWDALLNPVAGRLSDRTRTRWGARRPYVLGGGLAVAAGFALTFAGLATGTAGAWCAAAGFLLTATAFAFFQVPYVAMPAEITDRQEDRVRLVGGRVTFIGVAALVTGAAGPALVEAGGGGVAGHRWMGLFGAAVVAAGTLGVFLGTVAAPPGPVQRSEPSLRRQLAVARSSPPFMTLLRCALVQSAASGVLIAGAPYVADHVLPERLGIGPLVAAFVAPNLLTIGLWSRLGRRRGNRRGHAAASALFAAGCLVFLAAPVLPTPAVLLTMALAGVGHAGQLLFLYAMLQDCIAADTVRTSRRQAGVLSGVFTTVEGLGVAVGPFVYGLVLQLSGYVSSGTGRAAEQSTTTGWGLLTGFAVLPALATAAAIALLRSYDVQDSRRTRPPAEPEPRTDPPTKPHP
ncbi:sugar transporter [Streptomyces spiralis]|uniref:Sugar transporter n=1 Tax=Streptomyces spiralis TaxID=66376 RepID=A0A919A358_9ACTN|nr:MFS transporter [Streptomyces spiralis]GHE84052.1 sugar transporter [Streptomyces spiralis]